MQLARAQGLRPVLNRRTQSVQNVNRGVLRPGMGARESSKVDDVIAGAAQLIATPRIYWMDQHSKGFTKEVTAKLDKEMKADWLEPSYGFTDSTVWPLIPTAGAVIEIK
jgi:hypothetical protein